LPGAAKVRNVLIPEKSIFETLNFFVAIRNGVFEKEYLRFSSAVFPPKKPYSANYEQRQAGEVQYAAVQSFGTFSA
jgi:hypothetical protein